MSVFSWNGAFFIWTHPMQAAEAMNVHQLKIYWSYLYLNGFCCMYAMRSPIFRKTVFIVATLSVKTLSNSNFLLFFLHYWAFVTFCKACQACSITQLPYHTYTSLMSYSQMWMCMCLLLVLDLAVFGSLSNYLFIVQ